MIFSHSPNFWPDVLRIINMALTAIAVGAIGWYMLNFVFKYRSRFGMSEYRVTILAASSFTLLLLSGVIIDIIRLHQELSLYTPTHVAGAILALIAVFLAAQNQTARLK